MGPTEGHRRESLFRLHYWLLSHDLYDRQHKHVEAELLEDVSGMDLQATRAALRDVCLPVTRVLTDEERDLADGVEHVPRRAKVRRRQRPRDP